MYVKDRVIIRTTSNISYIGKICNNDLVNEDGFLIKTNPNLNMKIWIPLEEITNIIDNSRIYTAKEYKNLLCN